MFGAQHLENITLSQQNFTAASIPAPKFLRMNDDIAIPVKVPSGAIHTRGDLPLSSAYPCNNPLGCSGPADQLDDLDLSAPPPGFHTQGCSCGLACVPQIDNEQEFADTDLSLGAPLPGGPKPCYSACGVW